MTNKEKKRIKTELQKNIDQTIDEADQFARNTANRFSQLFVKASMEKFDKILNSGKVILKKKIRKGLKDGQTKKRPAKTSG